jgi:hypothetical protein
LFDPNQMHAKILRRTLDAHSREEFTESASLMRFGTGSQTNH